MVKVAALSDSHNLHANIEVPAGDVLIHCGDATISSSFAELESFARWFNSLPHKVKIFGGGNHDWELFNYKYDKFSKLFDNSVTLMNVGSVTVDGVKIYMCMPPGAWSIIPSGVDILVTHYPPYGILDELPPHSRFNDKSYPLNLGSTELLEEVTTRIKPRYHLFGHIHEQGGKRVIRDGTTFINNALLNENYQLVRKPIVFDIESKDK